MFGTRGFPQGSMREAAGPSPPPPHRSHRSPSGPRPLWCAEPILDPRPEMRPLANKTGQSVHPKPGGSFWFSFPLLAFFWKLVGLLLVWASRPTCQSAANAALWFRDKDQTAKNGSVAIWKGPMPHPAMAKDEVYCIAFRASETVFESC